MSTSGYPEAPPASDVAFDVERFEWTAVDRLEVRGRWTGVRGRRFMRPSLSVEVARGRRRLIALLEHKPWAAGDGDTWVAAFPWDGARQDVGRAVLEVGAGLAVELPAPREPQHVREAAAREAAAPPPAPEPPPSRSVQDQREEELWRAQAAAQTARREAEQTREQLAAERERSTRQLRDAEAARSVAERERERLRHEVGAVRTRMEEQMEAVRAEAERLRGALDARAAEVDERAAAVDAREGELAARESDLAAREAVVRERDAAVADRDAAVGARDALQREHEGLVAERDRAVRERRAAVAERDAARRERDAAAAARDAAVADRDRVLRVRQGPPRPPANATEPAVRVLGPVDDAGERDEPAPDPVPPTETSATVPLIADDNVATDRPRGTWSPGAPDAKPLLTRAEPLERSRGAAATWGLRIAALGALVLLAIVVLVLLAGGL
jgi:hypothetical protein